MNIKKQRKILILNLALAALILNVVMFVIEATGASDFSYKDIGDGVELMGDVYNHVIDDYIEELSPGEISKYAVEGILNNLDPYSNFLPPINYNQLQEDAQGEFGGLGIEIQKIGDYPRIMSPPFHDTPAERHRLRAGDEIVRIDGVSTKGMDISEVVGQLRGKVGTTVTIHVKRAGLDNLLKFPIERATIPLKNIPYYGEIEDGIGYIQQVRFNREASHEMIEALMKLQKNNENLKGIILDLRGNPGGLLKAAQEVANRFLLKDSDIVFTQERDPRKKDYFKAESTPSLHPSIPLVVLVNRGSASASEIVAGAIQDHDRGILIGVTTFGKGSVQTVFDDLPNRAGIKLTTAYYYTPSGRCIHNKRTFDTDYLSSENGDEEEQDTSAVEDSLSKRDEFYTLNKKRVVYGGGGITPDIIVKEKPYGNIVIQLFSNSVFFNFAIDYVERHPEIELDFKITDVIVNELKSYITDEKVFQYSIPGKKSLDDFRKIIKREKYNGDIVAMVDDLEIALKAKRDQDFESNIETIKRVLKREITVAKFGSRERALASREWDIQLKKAVEILNNPEKYRAILSKGAKTGIVEK